MLTWNRFPGSKKTVEELGRESKAGSSTRGRTHVRVLVDYTK
jgi:hypothetical protein